MNANFFLLIAVMLLLAACGSSGNYAPVVDRKVAPVAPLNTHIVSRGETLYSLSWRYGLEVKRFAAANKLRSPYTIFPGQKLLLKEGESVTAKPKNSSKTSSTSAKTGVQKAADLTPKQPAAKPKKVAVSNKNTAMSKRWGWPASANLTRRYSAASPSHRGIDLNGKLGEPVYAANSGTVVYAGSGLVGYGKLLIVKHSERYLSAYAHNNRLLVTEGQQVALGQRIAEMGDTGTDRVKLHFEIRLDGKPVNPQTLLPKR